MHSVVVVPQGTKPSGQSPVQNPSYAQAGAPGRTGGIGRNGQHGGVVVHSDQW